MKLDKKSAVLCLLALTSVVGIAGSTAGSLAWYAYSKEVSLSYVGTSISTSLLLNIGIIDDDGYLSDEQIEQYHLVKETNDTHTVLWSKSATGFPVDMLQDYLTISPYAVNELYPVSSHSRTLSSNDDLSLYRAIEHGELNTNTAASLKHYVSLPLAFKVLGSDNTKVANQNIWLTDATVQATGANADKAVRIFMDNGVDKFIMNPSDKSTSDGYTRVGGLLDLDDDHMYDYDIRTHQEYIYGEYSGSPLYNDEIYGVDEDHAPLDNINDTPYTDSPSSFLAKHDYYSYCVDTDSVNFKKAEYHSFGRVKPSVDSNGNYYAGTTGIPVARTSSEDSIGYLNLTIYLEGWDHSIINQAYGHSFNLGLEFQINRL